MIQHIYTVYDRAAQIYLQTFMLSHNDVQPVRNFTDAVRDQNSIFYKHVQDFELHNIGDFDDITGDLTPAPQNILVTRGVDLITQPE